MNVIELETSTVDFEINSYFMFNIKSFKFLWHLFQVNFPIWIYRNTIAMPQYKHALVLKYEFEARKHCLSTLYF